MHHHCPQCHAATQETDLYCHACGMKLKSTRLVIDDDYIPVPGVVGQPDMRIYKKSKAVRQAEIRRKVMIGGAVMGFFAVGVFGGLELIEAMDARKSPVSTQPTENVAEEILTDEASSRPVDHARVIARHALDLAQSN